MATFTSTTETLSFSLPATNDMPESARGPQRLDRAWPSLDWDTGIVPTSGPFTGSHKRQRQHRHQGDEWACECDDDESISSGSGTNTMEEDCKRALDHFPSPGFAFPTPALEFDFRLAVTLKPEPSRIDARRTSTNAGGAAAGANAGAGATACGTGANFAPATATASASAAAGAACKEITTISSGQWSGSFGNGRVMAGGYDLGQARGFRPIRIVEGAFVMQTTDEPPATLEMRTRGSLSGPCDVLDALLSPRQPKQIDPRRYGFRMFSTIKTADKRYAEIVNCGLWVASGVWKGEELIIDAYRVT